MNTTERQDAIIVLKARQRAAGRQLAESADIVLAALLERWDSAFDHDTIMLSEDLGRYQRVTAELDELEGQERAKA